jgi:serine/threonine protein kinase
MGLQQGMIVSGRYEVITPIKSGGMGAVYRAFDLHFQKREVALKEMLQEFSSEETAELVRRKFEEEAEILVNLSHPGIPRVLDHFIERNICYIVMDFIDGVSLDRLLEEYLVLTGKPVRQDLAVHYAVQLCTILEYLHSRKPMPIVHRDIKPGNIILRKMKQEVILVDFGLARAINPDSISEKTLVGTMGYAPLEQFKGLPEPRSDIYALGATMHHLISGIKPAPFSIEPLESVLNGVNLELAAIVGKAICESPKDRFQSATEMKTALLEVHPRLVDKAEEGSDVQLEEKTRIGENQHAATTTVRATDYEPPEAEDSSRKTLIDAGRLTRIEHIVTEEEKTSEAPPWRGRNVLSLIMLLISIGIFIAFINQGSQIKKVKRYMMFADPEAMSRIWNIADYSKDFESFKEDGYPCVVLGRRESKDLSRSGFIYMRVEEKLKALPMTIKVTLRFQNSPTFIVFYDNYGVKFADADEGKKELGYTAELVSVSHSRDKVGRILNSLSYERIDGVKPKYFSTEGIKKEDYTDFGLSFKAGAGSDNSTLEVHFTRLGADFGEPLIIKRSRSDTFEYMGLILMDESDPDARVFIRQLKTESP